MVGIATLFLVGHSLRIYLYFEEAVLFRNNSQKNITSLCDGYNEQSGMDTLNPCLDYPFYVLVRFAFWIHFADLTPELESIKATAKHVNVPSSVQLLLSFFPFPGWNPVRSPCTIQRSIPNPELLTLNLTRSWIRYHVCWLPSQPLPTLSSTVPPRRCSGECYLMHSPHVAPRHLE